MSLDFTIDKPISFNFFYTIRSHGWYDLPPFEYDEENSTLSYTFASTDARSAAFATIVDADAHLNVSAKSDSVSREKIALDVSHILRLDDQLDDFYSIIGGNEHLDWVVENCAGRLLRSPTVFEDLVKTICTTNCSWSLTRKMVSNLVEKLGVPDGQGRFAFPTPSAMASVGADFFRNEIKAGYRSEYLAELAEQVVAGEIEPDAWLHAEISSDELKKQIRKIKGAGNYAAENLMKLLGRYDGLTLDSWLRSRFYDVHNRSRKCADKKIERHYAKFGKWRGLAIWCDMTKSWFEDIARDA